MKLGMVLEGGGMRGIYTAGVLDYFMEQNFYPDGVIGVSAGACHACSYLSHQIGRSARINLEHCDDKRYMSADSWVKTGDFFNVRFAYHTLPDELEPYDYEAFDHYQEETPFYAAATNVDTGRAEYLPVREMHRDIVYVRASSSLPLLSRIVGIHGKRYLDGGVADSIPIDAFRELGYQRSIVVLTQVAGYRKKPNKMMPAIRAVYGRRYPNLVKASAERHIHYNEELDRVAALEAAGEAFVLRPSRLISISRIEKDRGKLQEMYQLGYDDAKANFAALLAFAKKAREEDKTTETNKEIQIKAVPVQDLRLEAANTAANSCAAAAGFQETQKTANCTKNSEKQAAESRDSKGEGQQDASFAQDAQTAAKAREIDLT